MTNAEARFNHSLRPRKPEGLLGRTAQDVHLDSHTAPELWKERKVYEILYEAGLGSHEARCVALAGQWLEHSTSWPRRSGAKSESVVYPYSKGTGLRHHSFNKLWRKVPESDARSVWFTHQRHYLWLLLLLLCCLMSSDVGWDIIKDKLRPMREHGSILLYVHGNHCNWGSLGRPKARHAQDCGHLDFHTAPELCYLFFFFFRWHH